MQEDENVEDRYARLAGKWLDGTLTESEEAEFDQWFNQDSEEMIKIDPKTAQSSAELKERIFKRILEKGEMSPSGATKKTEQKDKGLKLRRRRHLKVSYLEKAAIVVLAVMMTFFFVKQFKHRTEDQVATVYKAPDRQDALPGSEKAVLTLASGKRIFLDSTMDGVLAIQNGVEVSASKIGGLNYLITDSLLHNAHRLLPILSGGRLMKSVARNILTTPKGAIYHLTLSDGTKVWLNAASSIRFPVSFDDAERQVVIRGEAYFEVAKDASRPFKVFAGDMQVTVLGTHFNVNTYKDEQKMSTTLLEGAVEVQNLKTGQLRRIQPGEKAEILSTDKLEVSKVKAEMSIAWKNGLFQYEKASLHTILNEVARWYNIQVKWEGHGTQDLFTGTIPRNLKLSELLAVLDYANVDFELKDNILTVFT